MRSCTLFLPQAQKIHNELIWLVYALSVTVKLHKYPQHIYSFWRCLFSKQMNFKDIRLNDISLSLLRESKESWSDAGLLLWNVMLYGTPQWVYSFWLRLKTMTNVILHQFDLKDDVLYTVYSVCSVKLPAMQAVDLKSTAFGRKSWMIYSTPWPINRASRALLYELQ